MILTILGLVSNVTFGICGRRNRGHIVIVQMGLHCMVLCVGILVLRCVTIRHLRHGVLIRVRFLALSKVVVFVNVILYFVYGMFELTNSWTQPAAT